LFYSVDKIASLFFHKAETVDSDKLFFFGQPTMGGPPALGLGWGLTTLPRKTQYLVRITTHSLGTGRII
jgi:hypothetical protein